MKNQSGKISDAMEANADNSRWAVETGIAAKCSYAE